MKNLLETITIQNTKLVKLDGTAALSVQVPHALTQSAGYFKFILSQSSEIVFFRGQAAFYPTLPPSLLRGIGPSQAPQAKRTGKLKRAIKGFHEKAPIFNGFNHVFQESLLQHYGLRTTSIDLVDNIWVALWFACHRCYVSGTRSGYLHFERRRSASDVDEHAYIFLAAADAATTKIPGFIQGNETELVDLRVGCPSIFLRPHAQHGVLMRKRGKGPDRPVDYRDQIRGIVQIDLDLALSWLGDARTLDIHALFPPPYHDHGYKILLETCVEPCPTIGSIVAIGA